jgi:heptosyltransferase-2
MLNNNGESVFLIGAEQEVELCNYIAEKSKTKSLANQTTIPQILELIRNAKLVISNDSAPIHFASLFNIPAITIYGATSPTFGFYPLAENSLSIEDSQLFCHPCDIHGSKKCPRKNFECMKNITPEIVFNAAKKIMSEPKIL